MKPLLRYLALPWFALTALLAQAAVDTTDKLAPEPTVNVVWVWVFLVLFVGVCVAIGVGIYRADRKSKINK